MHAVKCDKNLLLRSKEARNSYCIKYFENILNLNFQELKLEIREKQRLNFKSCLTLELVCLLHSKVQAWTGALLIHQDVVPRRWNHVQSNQWLLDVKMYAKVILVSLETTTSKSGLCLEIKRPYYCLLVRCIKYLLQSTAQKVVSFDHIKRTSQPCKILIRSQTETFNSLPFAWIRLACPFVFTNVLAKFSSNNSQ